MQAVKPTRRMEPHALCRSDIHNKGLILLNLHVRRCHRNVDQLVFVEIQGLRIYTTINSRHNL